MVAKYLAAPVIVCEIVTHLMSQHVMAGQRAPIPLEAARQVVREHTPGQQFGPIRLDGFQWSRELEVGEGVQIIMVSCTLDGAIAAFRENGTQVGAVRANRITWFQVMDLDEDGISELVTEEISNSGTGVLMKEFVLYKIDTDSIKAIWRAESYARTSTPWSPKAREIKITEKWGFVRFDPSGAGLPGRMTYLAWSRGDRPMERVFELRGGKIQEQPASGPRRR